MGKCPVCHREYQGPVCEGCGYDESCNYEIYPTFQSIGKGMPALSARRAEWEAKNANRQCCASCGSRRFVIDDAGSILCDACLEPFSMERLRQLWMQKEPKKEEPPKEEPIREQTVDASLHIRAANQGYVAAQRYLAQCYRTGTGVKKDVKTAQWWQEKADQLEEDQKEYPISRFFDFRADRADAFSRYLAEAESGQAYAQMWVGDCYFFGCGVGTNHKEAIKWYNRASARGNVEAGFWLGYCYAFGFGVEKNADRSERYFQEAVQWFQAAADLGYADAQNSLGECYYWGYGVAKNRALAHGWFEKAAQQGDIHSLYRMSIGAYQGPEERIRWAKLAADRGHVRAQCDLGQICEKGEEVTQDLQAAASWYTLAAEREDKEGMYHLGRCYENCIGLPQNLTKALYWYTKAYKKGHPDALRRIFLLYADREQRSEDDCKKLLALCPGTVNDTESRKLIQELGYDLALDMLRYDSTTNGGVRWMLIAAQEGEAAAQRWMGRACLVGKYLPQNRTDGTKWLEKAAQQGDAEALYSLGWLMLENKNTRKNGVQRIQQAAEQGSASAMSWMWRTHMAGGDLPKDPQKTRYWLEKSAKQGDLEAKFHLGIQLIENPQTKMAGIVWLQQAANENHMGAQYQVGRACATGDGLPVSREKAIYWMDKASQQGHKEAAKAVKRLRAGKGI